MHTVASQGFRPFWGTNLEALKQAWSDTDTANVVLERCEETVFPKLSDHPTSSSEGA